MADIYYRQTEQGKGQVKFEVLLKANSFDRIFTQLFKRVPSKGLQPLTKISRVKFPANTSEQCDVDRDWCPIALGIQILGEYLSQSLIDSANLLSPLSFFAAYNQKQRVT